nr:uncharacterized protein LOC127348784 [Lolium perenne]
MEISVSTVFTNILYGEHTGLPLMSSYFAKGDPRDLTYALLVSKYLVGQFSSLFEMSGSLTHVWFSSDNVQDIHSILGGMEATSKKTYNLCVRPQTQIVLCFIMQLGNYNDWSL